MTSARVLCAFARRSRHQLLSLKWDIPAIYDLLPSCLVAILARPASLARPGDDTCRTAFRGASVKGQGDCRPRTQTHLLALAVHRIVPHSFARVATLCHPQSTGVPHLAVRRDFYAQYRECHSRLSTSYPDRGMNPLARIILQARPKRSPNMLNCAIFTDLQPPDFGLVSAGRTAPVCALYSQNGNHLKPRLRNVSIRISERFQMRPQPEHLAGSKSSKDRQQPYFGGPVFGSFSYYSRSREALTGR